MLDDQYDTWIIYSDCLKYNHHHFLFLAKANIMKINLGRYFWNVKDFSKTDIAAFPLIRLNVHKKFALNSFKLFMFIVI